MPDEKTAAAYTPGTETYFTYRTEDGDGRKYALTLIYPRPCDSPELFAQKTVLVASALEHILKALKVADEIAALQ